MCAQYQYFRPHCLRSDCIRLLFWAQRQFHRRNQLSDLTQFVPINLHRNRFHLRSQDNMECRWRKRNSKENILWIGVERLSIVCPILGPCLLLSFASFILSLLFNLSVQFVDNLKLMVLNEILLLKKKSFTLLFLLTLHWSNQLGGENAQNTSQHRTLRLGPKSPKRFWDTPRASSHEKQTRHPSVIFSSVDETPQDAIEGGAQLSLKKGTLEVLPTKKMCFMSAASSDIFSLRLEASSI